SCGLSTRSRIAWRTRMSLNGAWSTRIVNGVIDPGADLDVRALLNHVIGTLWLAEGLLSDRAPRYPMAPGAPSFAPAPPSPDSSHHRGRSVGRRWDHMTSSFAARWSRDRRNPGSALTVPPAPQVRVRTDAEASTFPRMSLQR